MADCSGVVDYSFADIAAVSVSAGCIVAGGSRRWRFELSNMQEANKSGADHWLVRPSTIKALWIGGGVILALTVLGDFFVHHHKVFGPEATFGFGAWFGFVSCVAMVFFAKFLGMFLKRPDDHYDD